MNLYDGEHNRDRLLDVCHHDNSWVIPCWRCGVRHPVKFVRHWWTDRRAWT